MQAGTHRLSCSEEERSRLNGLRASHGALLTMFEEALLSTHDDRPAVFQPHLCERFTTMIKQLHHSISSYKWNIYRLRKGTPEIMPLAAAADRASLARIEFLRIFLSGRPTVNGKSSSELELRHLQQHLLDLRSSIDFMEQHHPDFLES